MKIPQVTDLAVSNNSIVVEAYRNIATCDPSQNIYDDLVDEDEKLILEYAENLSSGISHETPKAARFEQYGNIENSLLCFNERFWRWGRFGDGTFGVWYGALEEETSIQETLHHRPELDKNDLLNTKDPVVQARRMFKASLAAESSADLSSLVTRYPLLVDPNEYGFCQGLGKLAIQNRIDMYLTPSVRNPGGTCTPVFRSSIISDKQIRTYFYIYPLDGSEPRVASMR